MNHGLLIGIITGILAGFVASKLFDGQGKGCIVNLVLGIIGGALGGWLFGLFGLGASSWIGELIVAVIGAMVFLWVWNKLLK
ncbi:MAG: GlsB/YeaQ/YmgE family stress response membrane protein [Bacteroidaceae bacterium]|nr:GlsB/YeaQ/YmgE family stress response membrane protein [Bacteroidaceae bacterium]